MFLTCNFRLTVERVKRALAGLDAYLLVATSRGVNVWVRRFKLNLLGRRLVAAGQAEEG